MASRGFEFAKALGGNMTPVITDWPLAAGTYLVGDLLTIDSSGYGTAGTATMTEVLGICQEAGTVTTAGTERKIAIVTRHQVWRCSMDASSTNAKRGYTKTIDIADYNTIDASDLTNGTMILYDTDTDDESNVLAYVVFVDTTFGNS